MIQSLNGNLIDGRKPPRFIIKFGQKEHLKMLQEGKLYMQPWRWFKDCESHKERRDVNEGVQHWFNPEKTEIYIAGHKFTRAGGTVDARMSLVDEKTNIFCAAAFWNGDDSKEDGRMFEEEIKDFGENFLAIGDIKVFFQKLNSALKDLHANGTIEGADAQRVSYFDEVSYDGEVGPFRKSSRYKHQKEWRLIIRKVQEDREPFVLDIGSIKEITILGETKDFKNKMERVAEGLVKISI